MKTALVLLNSDRFSFPLIHYLALEGRRYGWKTCVGSMFENNLNSLIKEDKSCSDVSFITITDFRQCEQTLKKADLVIALLPDTMLLQVVDRCLIYGKCLITPSKLNRQMIGRKSLAEETNTLILMECGFSPGLDHITAKKAIDNIQARGGKISSFKTFSGSLADENCINNPWQLKLTEPASEIINIGKQDNRNLINGRLQHISYYHLFERGEPIAIKGVHNTVAIPEGDSLYYRNIYQLQDATTVLKGKIVRKGFDQIWNLLVRLGITDRKSSIDMGKDKSFYHFLNSLLPYAADESVEHRLVKHFGASPEDLEKLKWLGLFSDKWIQGYKELTPATVLHYLMERKLAMKSDDKDFVVMQHQLEYTNAIGLHKFTATLVAEGKNKHESAIAKALGLTTGAAAKAFLVGNIKIKGLQIPNKKEIYDPILNELDDLGFAFHIEDKKLHDVAVPAMRSN